MSINVFISQPMRGRSTDGIERERQMIFDWLQYSEIVHGSRLVEIPLLQEWCIKGKPPAFCLGQSIQDMSCAGLVVFAPGWNTANGCCVEHEVCVRYSLPYVELEDSPAGGYRIVKEGGRQCSP